MRVYTFITNYAVPTNTDLTNLYPSVTPLQFVCLKGKVLLTGELIKNGAYVYVKGGHADCVQLLIGSGADVNAHDEREEIPEDKAKKWEKRTQCLKML